MKANIEYASKSQLCPGLHVYMNICIGESMSEAIRIPLKEVVK